MHYFKIGYVLLCLSIGQFALSQNTFYKVRTDIFLGSYSAILEFDSIYYITGRGADTSNQLIYDVGFIHAFNQEGNLILDTVGASISDYHLRISNLRAISRTNDTILYLGSGNLGGLDSTGIQFIGFMRKKGVVFDTVFSLIDSVVEDPIYVRILKNGDLIVSGEAIAWNKSNYSNDWFVSRFSKKGKLLWYKQFVIPKHNEYLSGMALDSAENIYLGGMQRRYVGGTNTGFISESILTKLDKNGNEIWRKVVIEDIYNNGGPPFINSQNILVHSINIGHDTLAWNSALYNSIRTFTLDGIPLDTINHSDFSDFIKMYSHGGINNIIEINDSHYLCAYNQDDSVGRGQITLVQYNAQFQIQWKRSYKYVPGSSANDYVYDMIQSSDGGIVLVGSASSDTANTRPYIMKLDSFGCLIPGCQYFDTGIVDTTKIGLPPLPASNALIYPNPVETGTHVFVEIGSSEFDSYGIFDISGKQVNFPPLQVLAQGKYALFIPPDLSPGLYILKAQLRNGEKVLQKIIVQRE